MKYATGLLAAAVGFLVVYPALAFVLRAFEYVSGALVT